MGIEPVGLVRELPGGEAMTLRGPIGVSGVLSFPAPVYSVCSACGTIRPIGLGGACPRCSGDIVRVAAVRNDAPRASDAVAAIDEMLRSSDAYCLWARGLSVTSVFVPSWAAGAVLSLACLITGDKAAPPLGVPG